MSINYRRRPHFFRNYIIKWRIERGIKIVNGLSFKFSNLACLSAPNTQRKCEEGDRWRRPAAASGWRASVAPSLKIERECCHSWTATCWPRFFFLNYYDLFDIFCCWVRDFLCWLNSSAPSCGGLKAPAICNTFQRVNYFCWISNSCTGPIWRNCHADGRGSFSYLLLGFWNDCRGRHCYF